MSDKLNGEVVETVEVVVDANRFLWGDYKRFPQLQERAKSKTMTPEDTQWFIGFVDRVCVGSVDEVPMPVLMRALWVGLNADMTRKMDGAGQAEKN